MSTHHGFGPELGSKPTTYTCRCGFRNTDYGEVSRHVTDENDRAHAPRRLTTIHAIGIGYPVGIEVASTPHGDDSAAIEIRTIVRESEGRYQRNMVLVSRSDIPLLIEELEAHRLDKDLDPCAACAAQAFAARLSSGAMRIAHTCPEPSRE